VNGKLDPRRARRAVPPALHVLVIRANGRSRIRQGEAGLAHGGTGRMRAAAARRDAAQDG
jgi:hypothetical protein